MVVTFNIFNTPSFVVCTLLHCPSSVKWGFLPSSNNNIRVVLTPVVSSCVTIDRSTQHPCCLNVNDVVMCYVRSLYTTSCCLNANDVVMCYVRSLYTTSVFMLNQLTLCYLCYLTSVCLYAYVLIRTAFNIGVIFKLRSISIQLIPSNELTQHFCFKM